MTSYLVKASKKLVWCKMQWENWMLIIAGCLPSIRYCTTLKTVCTTNSFWQLLPKGEDLPVRERIHLPVLEESSPFGRHKI